MEPGSPRTGSIREVCLEAAVASGHGEALVDGLSLAGGAE